MRAHRILATALLVMLAPLLGSSPPVVSGSRHYRPGHADDATLFARGRRNVVPDDVRAGRAGAGPMAWAGVVSGVQEAEVGGTRVCRGVKSDGPQTEMTADANRLRVIPRVTEGDMAVVVGEPVRIDEAGVVHLRCLFLDVRPRQYYATDRWDYGRRWRLERDRSDFRILSKF